MNAPEMPGFTNVRIRSNFINGVGCDTYGEYFVPHNEPFKSDALRRIVKDLKGVQAEGSSYGWHLESRGVSSGWHYFQEPDFA